MSIKNKMNRRSFTKLLAVGGAAAIVSPNAAKAKPTLLSKAKPLAKGSKIGLVAPGTRVSERFLNLAKSNLTKLGFEVFCSRFILCSSCLFLSSAFIPFIQKE